MRLPFERMVAMSVEFDDIVDMKYTCGLLLLFCAAPVFCQDARSTVADKPETSNWSKLGPTVEGSNGFTLSGRGIRLNGSGLYELWVKISPTNRGSFVKRYRLPGGSSYVLQYATVDCRGNTLSLERTAAFNSHDVQIEGKLDGIIPASKKDAVKPGSIGETLFKYICEGPNPPATDNAFR
ncbi:MAG: hypothetical protein AB7F88_02915 [Pyrinomonadaceae bacterium]